MERPIEVTSERFWLPYGGERVAVRVDTPKALAKEPRVLVSLAAGAEETLEDVYFGQPGLAFLQAGHRVVSLDLPCHGARVSAEQGAGIAGFRKLFAGGTDVFAQAVWECRLLVDELIARKLGKAGQIDFCGCSRGGYLALRALAEDERIRGASAVCPVTDWARLSEFALEKECASLAQTALHRYARQLAGKPLYLVIGNCDTRVSTESCLKLYLAVEEETRRLGKEKSCYLAVTRSEGHTVTLEERYQCGAFLLR